MPRKRRTEISKRARPFAETINRNNDENCLDDTLDAIEGDLDDCESHCGAQPPQRNAANARERARMRVLSRAFCRLKTTLPWVPADTKLSKLDTLRLATSYIMHLRDILLLPAGEAPAPGRLQAPPPPTGVLGASRTHPLNLTWPFTLQQQPGSEPWLSRTSSSSCSRLPRDSNQTGNTPSGSSASSGVDEDALQDDEGKANLEIGERRRMCGGTILSLEDSTTNSYCAEQQSYSHFQRDRYGNQPGALLDLGY